jgi:hypothetical protein
MTVRRNQLIIDILCGEEIIQSGRQFVESLQFRFETFDREIFMDATV